MIVEITQRNLQMLPEIQRIQTQFAVSTVRTCVMIRINARQKFVGTAENLLPIINGTIVLKD